MKFEPVSSVQCELGEGPVFDDQRNALWYCDIIGRAVHYHPLDGSAGRSFHFPSEVGSIGLARSGRVVVALRHAVGLFDPETEAFERVAEIEAERGGDTRLNDGKVGPDGAFWVGTMDDRGLPAREPIGTLYRVSADGSVEVKVSDICVSNGLAWSADGRSMYHSDSSGPWIDRWDFDPATGEMSNRTRIATLDEATGRPDGAATDADGFYWSAGISAGRLNRFSPDGKLVQSIDVPVAAPTMPCFGGPDLKTLYVTSLRVGRSAALLEKYPLTGTVIAAASPVAGAPVARFAD